MKRTKRIEKLFHKWWKLNTFFSEHGSWTSSCRDIIKAYNIKEKILKNIKTNN